MVQVSFTVEEVEALRNVLECAISELHSEIMHTDRFDLRSCLKVQKQLLVKILDTLKNAEGVVQAAQTG
jgi:hypothetical protein